MAAGLAAITLSLLSAACERSAAPPNEPPVTTSASASASPSASADPSSSPSPTAPATDPAIIFAADGIGPYVIGIGLSELSARSLVTKIEASPHCENASSADATGRYSGKLTLSFLEGRLTAVHTDSTDWITPSGAMVGMTLTQIQEIYGSRGVLLTGTLGNKAYSVRVPATGLAVIFYLDSSNTKVNAMSGGEAQALEDAVKNGEGC
jgi:hypothetical protein